MADAALQGLRPVHWPTADGATPTQDVVTGAALGLLLALALIAVLQGLSHAGRRPRREALRRISAAADASPGERIAATAAALRAYAVDRYGDGAVAADGGDWLAGLARRTGRPASEAAVLTAALYAPASADDADRAEAVARAMIRSR